MRKLTLVLSLTTNVFLCAAYLRRRSQLTVKEAEAIGYQLHERPPVGTRWVIEPDVSLIAAGARGPGRSVR